MKQAIAIINEVENQRPYKQPGNRDSYSQYNEGWSDACDEIRQQLQKALDNSSPEVSGEWEEEFKEYAKDFCKKTKEKIHVEISHEEYYLNALMAMHAAKDWIKTNLKTK